jgi:hypothetical protein
MTLAIKPPPLVWSVLVLCGLLEIGATSVLLSQQRGNPAARIEDHQNMMAQLGIRKLRPAPTPNESAPNHANYDEALANPYPDLPDVLTLESGKKVTSAKMWREQRRPEIIEDFDREVFGRVARNVPKVTWTVVNRAEGRVGPYRVIGKQLTGHVDNSSFPEISVDIQMTLVTPADAKGPVPVMMMFGTREKRCRPSTSACSTANSPGGNTTAGTRTLRTGSISSLGPTGT